MRQFFLTCLEKSFSQLNCKRTLAESNLLLGLIYLIVGSTFFELSVCADRTVCAVCTVCTDRTVCTVCTVCAACTVCAYVRMYLVPGPWYLACIRMRVHPYALLCIRHVSLYTVIHPCARILPMYASKYQYSAHLIAEKQKYQTHVKVTFL